MPGCAAASDLWWNGDIPNRALLARRIGEALRPWASERVLNPTGEPARTPGGDDSGDADGEWLERSRRPPLALSSEDATRASTLRIAPWSAGLFAWPAASPAPDSSKETAAREAAQEAAAREAVR